MFPWEFGDVIHFAQNAGLALQHIAGRMLAGKLAWIGQGGGDERALGF